MSFLSPSQTFGMVACVAAAVFLIELLFQGARGWLWVVTFAVAILGGGSKPTVLPILVGAVGLAAVVMLVQTRRVPVRKVVAGALLVATSRDHADGCREHQWLGLQFLAVLKSSG